MHRNTLADLLGQRIFGIARGHPDGNDAEHLADDPIHKLLLGRDPVAGAPLASRPTISRFENCATRTALYRMGRELATRVIERHARRLDGRARRIIIDLDPTDDRAHGAQQLSFFNGYYDSWCYLPLLAFLTFDREQEQYLCAAVLRPGNVPATKGAIGILARLLPLLRSAFPRAYFLVRLDGGFATPALFDFLDAEPDVRYVVAMAKERRPGAARRTGPGPCARREHQDRTDCTRLRRNALCRRHLEQPAPRRHQGGSRPPRRPRAAGQPALRRYQCSPRAPLRLREGLLRPRRHREPHQGTARRSADRPVPAAAASGPTSCGF